jgi:hypothetical protein
MTVNNDAWAGLQQNREYLRRNAENATRHGYAYGKFNSTGWGEFAFPDCFEFGLTYTEEPYVAHSYSLDGATLVNTRFPRAFGGVYAWKQNNRGFYVGAWCFAVVDTRSPYIRTTVTKDPGYTLTHYFNFAGMAMKDLPDHLAEL